MLVLLVARSSARESELVMARTGQSRTDTAGPGRGAPEVHTGEESMLLVAVGPIPTPRARPARRSLPTVCAVGCTYTLSA
jgi:hypothetical protein